MNILKHLSLLAIAMFSASSFASEPFYTAEKGQSSVALYGTLDVAVANQYLAQFGLEAVEVAPGRALTGFHIDYYAPNSVVLKNPPIQFGDYFQTDIPMLVRAPGTPIQSAYFFNQMKASTEISRQIYSASAFEGYYSSKDLSPLISGTPFFAQASQSDQPFNILFVAPSKSQLWSKQTALNFDSVLAYGGKVTTASYQLSGNIYLRNFDAKAGDFYWIDESTLHGKLLKEGNFQPVSWQILDRVSVKGYLNY